MMLCNTINYLFRHVKFMGNLYTFFNMCTLITFSHNFSNVM